MTHELLSNASFCLIRILACKRIGIGIFRLIFSCRANQHFYASFTLNRISSIWPELNQFFDCVGYQFFVTGILLSIKIKIVNGHIFLFMNRCIEQFNHALVVLFFESITLEHCTRKIASKIHTNRQRISSMHRK